MMLPNLIFFLILCQNANTKKGSENFKFQVSRKLDESQNQCDVHQFFKNNICQECHYSCLTCYEGNNDNCNQCLEGSKRSLSGQNCLCESTYFNEIDQAYCQKCRFPCQDCFGRNFLNCSNCQNMLILNNFSCICEEQMFFNYLTNFCESCHYTCFRCKESSNIDCMSCNISSNRIMDGLGQCICLEGYYEIIGNPICQKCHENCKACFGPNSNNCLSCFNNLTNDDCSCLNGNSLELFECQKCHPRCITCNGIFSYNCLSCSNINNSLNQNQCVCNNGYYYLNNLCVQCNSNCATCQYQSDYCLSCSSGLLPNSKHQCQTCSVCSTCDNSTKQCLSCSAGKFGEQCDQNCDSKCQTCAVSSGTVCNSCVPPFVLSGNQCVCSSGTTLVNGTCVATCPSGCNGCSGTACDGSGCKDGFYGANCALLCHTACRRCYGTSDTQCNLCQLNAYVGSGSKCQCNTGYYMDSTYHCFQCHYSCRECSDYHTCTDCQYSYRNLTTCLCQTNYYDVGVRLCSLTVDHCGTYCQNCVSSGSTYICQACALTGTFRIDDLINKCPCDTGYFDSGAQICEKCNYKCNTCTTSSGDDCLTCSSSNRDINLKCNCKTEFDEVNFICIQQTTTTPISSNAVIINYESLLTPDYQNQELILINYSNKNTNQCFEGYYLFHNKCLPCEIKCKTCTLWANNCITCQIFRQKPPYCNCSQGFQEIDSQCQPCDNFCELCTNSGCDKCLNQFLLNINNQCECQSGYFQSNYECLQCASQCSECIYQFDYCTQCSFNRILPHKCICPIGTIEQSQLCINCNKKCDTCEIDVQNCLTCSYFRINAPVCACQLGYYETISLDCLKCNKKCLTCLTTESNCLICGNQRSTIDCICNQGYFENSLGDCQICNSNCYTCVEQSYNCQSCDEQLHFILSGSNCICNNGYYLESNECQSCEKDPSKCIIAICGNGILEVGEQCDDWNLKKLDGCDEYCKVEKGCYCEVNQNSEVNDLAMFSQCFSCEDKNCQYCSDKTYCYSCENGYYLQDEQCHACDYRCSECYGPSLDDCVSCFQDNCLACEQTPGLYTFGNICVSKCGDGILILDEECDDGNTNNGDGCSQQCFIEENWECRQNICEYNDAYSVTQAKLFFESPRNIYQSHRVGKILFNHQMEIEIVYAAYKWNQILLNAEANQYQITLQINEQSQFVNEIQISIDLFQSLDQIQYSIDFINYQIYDKEGELLETQYLEYNLGQYFKVSNIMEKTAVGTKKFGLIMLLILLIIAVVGLVMQSLEFYWNALDMLQLISYLAYINVQFPYLHNEFLSLFEFAKLDFLNNLFPIQFFNLDQDNEEHSYPLLVERDVQENLFVNLSSIIIMYLIPLAIYYFTKLIINLNSTKLLIDVMHLRELDKQYFIKIQAFKFIYFVKNFALDYQMHFKYEICLRVYLSSLYDLNFACFVTVYCWNQSKYQTNLEKINYLIANFIIGIQLTILIMLSNSVTQKHYQHKTMIFQRQFGTLYEGLKLSRVHNREAALIQPFKKLLFMASLLLFFNNPLYQIGMLISLQLISCFIQLQLEPFLSQLEELKVITSELGLLISLNFMLFYFLQENFLFVTQYIVEIVSYAHISIYIVMLSVQVIVDLYQQTIFLLSKYPKLKCKSDQNSENLNHQKYYQNQQFIVIEANRF